MQHSDAPDAAPTGAARYQFPFQDPSQPLERRIDDLLGRLELAEKVGQMMHGSPAIERLGIPEYNWWSEACHGVGRAGRATVFPQVIGLGATWNSDLVRRVASAISDEARAKHHHAARHGQRGQYQGLTFWTPNINIFRDPRWGRGQETFGEDPCLTGELGVAMVRGLQGDDPQHMKVAACAKHYAVHSGPESERHSFDAQPTPKDLWETYLPAFHRLVDAGVEAVMGAYNRTLGEPCCASNLLIRDILRGRWGFGGHFVSDCAAIDDFHLYHGVTRNRAESAAMAVRAGCDLNCGCTYADLYEAVKDGLVTEDEIDTCLRRLLSARFRLGLLDPEGSQQWAGLPLDIVESPAHRKLAREAAAESVVLLKNSGVLPLKRDGGRVLVVGPNAVNINALLGNYYGLSHEMVDFVRGVLEAAGPNAPVNYRQGCPLVSEQSAGVNYTFPEAEAHDVVVAVMGLDSSLEGEEGDAVASSSGGDRATIELPAVQLAFLKELRKYAKKLVLVLTGGSAIAVPEAHALCDAVLQVWYPGCEGGRALADVLYGDVAPSGRMPVTVPMSTQDLPPFTDYHMRGRTYRFLEKEPLYPFGFGLGYARTLYKEARAERTGQGVTVSAVVANTGTVRQSESVQCYVIPPQGVEDAPHATLVAFDKVELAAGESRRVAFALPREAFSVFAADGSRQWPGGRFTVAFGTASPGRRAMALGAPEPATVALELAAGEESVPA